jgi:hypothetical protein
MTGRFCVAWSNHNWVTLQGIDRHCSLCGVVEPRRTNRAVAVPRKAGRYGPAVAVDAGATQPPCSKSESGTHAIQEGRGYDYCPDCGLVIRWPVRTKADRPVVVGTPSFPTPKTAYGIRRVHGKASVRSPKAVQRHRGKVARLFARDGEGCFYCGCTVDALEVVLDHFIPRSVGGPDDLENRRSSCIPCDKAKRDQMPWEFMPERFTADHTPSGMERTAEVGSA